ncbi:MAG: hypothetical protein FJX56_10415, partial [Alphaproteobacteria bacterium]|nr:hypothetical protein [Alphaproteobacteria bacterium]
MSARATPPRPPNALLDQALAAAAAHHRAGRVPLARALYEEILRAAPDQADALHLYGVLKAQSGDAAGAVALLARAVKRAPRRAAFHADL